MYIAHVQAFCQPDVSGESLSVTLPGHKIVHCFVPVPRQRYPFYEHKYACAFRKRHTTSKMASEMSHSFPNYREYISRLRANIRALPHKSSSYNTNPLQ